MLLTLEEDCKKLSLLEKMWMKNFKDMSSIIRKTIVSLKLRRSLYNIYVRSVLLRCGAECWDLKKEENRKIELRKMRMLRMICRKKTELWATPTITLYRCSLHLHYRYSFKYNSWRTNTNSVYLKLQKYKFLKKLIYHKLRLFALWISSNIF